MIAVGITSGHVLLSDWLFLIAAIILVLLAVAHAVGGHAAASVATARSVIVQCVAVALIALGLMFL